MTARLDQSFDPTPDQPLGIPTPNTSAVETLALTIVWSRTEADRIGECALITEPCVVGRGGQRPEDDLPRGHFAAMRPGKLEAGAPLAAPTLSRVHVRLTPDDDGITFERTGKGPIEVDATRAEKGLMGLGSTMLLGGEMLVVCDRRAAPPGDAVLARTPEFPFGANDPFGITGETAVTWRLRDHVRFASGSQSPLLIVGPPGAGKDLVARAVYAGSASRKRPFVVVGGATLTRAELDALQARTDAPFVVIEELSDVAQDVQPHLARTIALTSSMPLPRMRIVATNSGPLVVASPTSASTPGDAVRADLASRFILTVRVPGLDERKADIPLIARAILREIAAEQPEIGLRFFDNFKAEGGGGEPRFSPGFVDRLVRHRWQAHVRELTTLLWTSMTTATESWLDATPGVVAHLETSPDAHYIDPNRLDAETVRDALEDANGKVAVAARELGLKNRWVLYRLMERLDIKL